MEMGIDETIGYGILIRKTTYASNQRTYTMFTRESLVVCCGR